MKKIKVKDIQEYISNNIDVFLQAEIESQSSGVVYNQNKINTAIMHIARITNCEYVNLNSNYLLSKYSGVCRCSSEKFIGNLEIYIKNHDISFWKALSMNKAPTPNELIEHILKTNRDAIISQMGKNLNNPPKNYKNMLVSSIIDRWEEKWERECIFQARLYDIHNNFSELSETKSKHLSIDYARCEIAKNPDKYSRYVILMKTPFNKEPVIYTIGGKVSSKHICTNGAKEKEWKAIFYDYMDHKMCSMECEHQMEQQHLMHNLRDNNWLYYVLLYRNAPDKNFTVQFYKSDKCFNNPCVVMAIEKNIIKNNTNPESF